MTDKTGLASRLTDALALREQTPLTVTVNGGHTIEIIWQTPLSDGVQIVYRSGSPGELYTGVYFPERKQMSPYPEEEAERILLLLEQLLPPEKTLPETDGVIPEEDFLFDGLFPEPVPEQENVIPNPVISRIVYNPETGEAVYNPEVNAMPVNPEISTPVNPEISTPVNPEISTPVNPETKPAPTKPETSKASDSDVPDISLLPPVPEPKPISPAEESCRVSKWLAEAQKAEKAGRWQSAAQAYESALVTGRIMGELLWKLEFACGECFRKAGQPERAYFHLVRAARNGYADAALSCGVMCENGEGTEASLEQARNWYQKVAVQPSVRKGQASYLLGKTYEKENPAEALPWYQQAAKLGHLDAQKLLGKMFYNGAACCEKNPEEAFRWYKMAAEQGDCHAIYMLGRMYYLGQYVTEDKARALEYYKKSAESGYPKAAGQIALMYFNGDGVKKDKKLALQYAEPAIEATGKFAADPFAQLVCGLLCYYGFRGFPKDLARGAEYLRRAADCGLDGAQYLYGGILYTGRGIPADEEKGAEYIRKSVEQGNPAAKRMAKFLGL